MKSPQEKAKELVDLFYYPTLRWALIHAKECALKCVDEILNEENNFIQTDAHFLYWQQVKEEITKYEN